MPEFKIPRIAIPCSADLNYIHSDNDEFCCPSSHPHPLPVHHSRPHPHYKEKVEFACGNSSGLPLPIYGIPWIQGANSNGTASFSFTPLVVGTVSLDTSSMSQPAVKVDFSSIVNFLVDVSAYTAVIFISIDFCLVKICNGSRTPLGTWTYRKSINLDDAPSSIPLDSLGLQLDFREAFNFSWCECQDCPGCCTYVVEIVNFNSYDITSASLTNVSINALAVGN